MRALNGYEVEQVSGGDWEIGFNADVVRGQISGDETIQEIFAAAADLASDAYWGARDAMADFFTWWDPAGLYASGCHY